MQADQRHAFRLCYALEQAMKSFSINKESRKARELEKHTIRTRERGKSAQERAAVRLIEEIQCQTHIATEAQA
jgi:hypothetical protein